MPAERALPRIAVAGSGVAALLATAVLARMLPPGHVLLIEPPGEPDPIYWCSQLWPVARAVHARIGLSDAALVERAGARERRADAYEGWPRRERWLLPTDADAVGHGVFQQWLADLRTPIGTWLEGRREPDAPPPLCVAPAAYHALLSALVDQLRVPRRAVASLAVERGDSGGVAALVAQGTRIVADWYVDATGPAALVASAIGARTERVEHATDLLGVGPRGSARGIVPGRWKATADGWVTAVADGDGARALMGFHTGATDRGAAERRFRLEAGSDAATWVAVPQHRRDAWTHNVLALGSAAFAPDPVARLELATVHGALLHLCAMLPGAQGAAAIAAEFNRRTRAEQETAVDYGHALTQVERQGAYWAHAARLPTSDRLARMRDQFARRGRLPPRDDDVVADGAWRVLFAGLGHHPGRPDAVARAAAPSQGGPTASNRRRA